MVTPGTRARTAGRIGQFARDLPDARTLRLAVVAAVGEIVAFDAYAWLLTDPETAVGTAPLADVGALADLAELPELIRRKYLTPINRWTTLGDVATVHGLAADDVDAAPLWGWLRDRHGVVDVASIVFRDRFGTWGFLDLWRGGDRSPFDADDVGFLRDLVEPVTTGLRRTQAATFTTAVGRDPRLIGPTVLLLSPDLDRIGQTPATEDYLRVLVPPDEDRPPVPASAYNVAAQLLAVEAGIDDHPPWARVHLLDGLWLTMRAARLGAPDDGASDIAVTIEETSPADRVAVFARAFGLTPRERELLTLVVAGRDTRQLGAELFVSANTVQDHLTSIFAKTAVRNRRSLVSLALGT